MSREIASTAERFVERFVERFAERFVLGRRWPHYQRITSTRTTNTAYETTTNRRKKQEQEKNEKKNEKRKEKKKLLLRESQITEAVGEDFEAYLGFRKDRFRVKLHRSERKLFVLDRHDLPKNDLTATKKL